MIPTREEVLSVMQRVLRDELRLEVDLRPSTDLLAELKLDSIQQLALVVALENHFQVAFVGEDEAEISTVQSVIELVQRRAAEDADALD